MCNFGLTVQIQITDWIWILSQVNLTTFFLYVAKKNNLVSSKKLPCEVIPQGKGGHKYSFPPSVAILARDISVWTFHNKDISTRAFFRSAAILAHGHFVSMSILTQGLFGTGTFWRPRPFSMRYFGTWTFWHMNISAHEHFGTWIFWRLSKQYEHYGTDILAPVLLCQTGHFNVRTF